MENIYSKYSNISKAALQGRGLYPIIFGQERKYYHVLKGYNYQMEGW